jgi:two-component system, OmpR family, sensor histidine kinase MtrB
VTDVKVLSPPPGIGSPQRRLTPRRLRRWSLRSRILWTFGIGTFVLAALLAVTTYGFTRSNLVDQRDRAGINQTYGNARRMVSDLRSNPSSVQPLLARLSTARPLVRYRDAWTAGDAQFGSDQVPRELLTTVVDDGEPARMITIIGGMPMLVIGIPLPEVGASYFEFISLDEVRSTLRSVGLSLLLAGGITTALGIILGSIAAQRAVRPLVDAAQAARTIASGRLDTRIETTDDPDLGLLAVAFNDMATALQQRVERDARFASDVSHELRSPLMTLSASIQVLESRRDELSERAQAALDLLSADVVRFKGLVEDLLEISRFDAGAVRLHLEVFPVAEFVRQAVAVSSMPSTPVLTTPESEDLLIRGDRRRLARVVANLIDNGRIHGGGDLQISVSMHLDADATADDTGGLSLMVRIAVDDHGPGVPTDDRDLIFERFARGGSAGRRGSSEGAGLGLSLVREHVRLHRGSVWVTDRADGDSGSRFIIELPAERGDR